MTDNVKTVTGTITPAGAETRAITRKLYAFHVPFGSLPTFVLTITGSLDGTITPAGTQTNIHHHFSAPTGTITPAGALTSVHAHYKSLSGTFSLAGFLHTVLTTECSTMFDLTLDLARVITNVVESIATDGSATTVIDTKFPWSSDGTNPADDHYNYGTIWMTSGLNINHTATITDWTRLTSTFTFDTMTLLNATGDRYAVANREYPLWLLRQSIDEALEEIGGTDTTSTTLATIANTISYALPSGVYNVRSVEVANGTTAPYTWMTYNNWKLVGSTIELDSAPPGGYTIRMTYYTTPTWLYLDSDTISDRINPELVKWTAAIHALLWRLKIMGDDDPNLKSALVINLDKAQKNVTQFRSQLSRTPKAHHYNILGSF